MKTLMIYRKNSEHESRSIEYARDFERQTGHKLELIEADSQEGAAMCRDYEILDLPTIVSKKDDGQLSQIWVGASSLPTYSELGYYCGM